MRRMGWFAGLKIMRSHAAWLLQLLLLLLVLILLLSVLHYMQEFFAWFWECFWSKLLSLTLYPLQLNVVSLCLYENGEMYSVYINKVVSGIMCRNLTRSYERRSPTLSAWFTSVMRSWCRAIVVQNDVFVIGSAQFSLAGNRFSLLSLFW